jgi:2'-5' RNA ligase
MKKQVKKPSVHRTIRFPGDLDEKIEKRIKKIGGTFTGMVVYLLNKVIDKK